MAVAVSAGDLWVEESIMETLESMDGSILESLVGELSIRMRWEGDESLAARRADRPTAPAPKMAMEEAGAGFAMFLR